MTNLWIHHDCDPRQPSEATFQGTITLDAIDTRHLAGSLQWTVDERSANGGPVFANRIEAHFDATE